MQAIRRWWERYSLQTFLVAGAISLAWLIRQSHGTVILESYQLLSRPFQITKAQPEELLDARVRELKFRLTELEEQNIKLKQQLNLPISGYENQRYQGTWATVIGRSADAWWQQMVINRGQNDGVVVGSVVVAQGGLVGRVTDVSGHSARVLLVSDPMSQVGVLITRSRFAGTLQGYKDGQGLMQFFERDPDVKVGDIVHTSEFSQLYPSQIPIGRVISVNIDKQPSPEAVVEFTTPVGSLEYVKVYPAPVKPNVGTEKTIK